MTKKDECQELKNIKYRGMLEHHNTNNMVNETTENMTNLDDFLEKEKQLNVNIPWTKLDKTVKVKKINEYVDKYVSDNNLTATDSKTMRKYLKDLLDKRQLNRVKDVTYDKDKGTIVNIPSLCFNKSNKKFTMKRNEKRTSTSKCLAPKKPRKTRKNENKIVKENKDKIDTININQDKSK